MICLLDKIPFNYIAQEQWQNTTPNYATKTSSTQSAPKTKQKFAYLKGVPNISEYYKNYSVANLEAMATGFGLSQQDIQKYGSTKKKATYYKVFEELKASIE